MAFFLLALLLILPYRGYLKWLTRHGQLVEGTITNVTQEQESSRRRSKIDCYEVTWTDPRTLQPLHSIIKYPTSLAPNKHKGETVPVYVHSIFTRLRAVRMSEDTSQLWRAWQEGALLAYLAGVCFGAVRLGGVVAALFAIPALANVLPNFQNWQVGLGLLLGGFLISFITGCLVGIFLRR